MGIKDLPRGGSNFKATLGPGSFQKKLNQASRYGDLNNLDSHNREAIIKEIKKREGVIRRMGGLTSEQARRSRLNIQRNDKTMTKGDIDDLKELMEVLSRNNKEKKKSADGGKSIIVDGKELFLSKEKIQRNVKGNRALDEEPKPPRKSYSINPIAVRTTAINAPKTTGSQRVKINKTKFNLNNNGEAGFAGVHKSPNKPEPVSSSFGGKRPIGL